MDRPEISYMKPGKKDHYTKKVNGEKSHGQKRYLLWPLRDILDMLNESDISVGDSLKDMFEKELSFTLFYKFIKARKQYIFNCKIPQNTCLCETCENVIVEEYSCNSNKKDCMLSIYEECKSHGLEQNDFNKKMMKPMKMMVIVQAALIATEMVMQYANIISGKRGAGG